jgi:hypothetical protein
MREVAPGHNEPHLHRSPTSSVGRWTSSTSRQATPALEPRRRCCGRGDRGLSNPDVHPPLSGRQHQGSDQDRTRNSARQLTHRRATRRRQPVAGKSPKSGQSSPKSTTSNPTPTADSPTPPTQRSPANTTTCSNTNTATPPTANPTARGKSPDPTAHPDAAYT